MSLTMGKESKRQQKKNEKRKKKKEKYVRIRVCIKVI